MVSPLRVMPFSSFSSRLHLCFFLGYHFDECFLAFFSRLGIYVELLSFTVSESWVEKENCKYRHQFRKSVQGFHAKEVCPTFWDRPPSKLRFFRRAFSLSTAMQILKFDIDHVYLIPSEMFCFSATQALWLHYLRWLQAESSEHHKDEAEPRRQAREAVR